MKNTYWESLSYYCGGKQLADTSLLSFLSLFFPPSQSFIVHAYVAPNLKGLLNSRSVLHKMELMDSLHHSFW